MGLIYCFLDIEVDGPTPGENSMLSLGFAAFDEDEREVAVFETNLEMLEGACGAENVMRWWRTHPEAWAYIRRNPVPPAVGMEHCLDWLKGLGPALVLAAHPLLMDGVWLDWYLRRFCNAAVFSGPFRRAVPSSARAWMCRPMFRRPGTWSTSPLARTIRRSCSATCPTPTGRSTTRAGTPRCISTPDDARGRE